MFRHRFHIPNAKAPPVDPVEGFLFRIDQRWLQFGADRKTPVSSRPALPGKRRDDWAVVLPVTSKPQRSPEFYKLDDEDVSWKNANAKSTFIYWRYETVPTAELNQKLAVISQNARMNVAHWLRRKYEGQEA